MAENVFRTSPFEAAMGGTPALGTPDRPQIDSKVEIERLASQTRVPANILMAMADHVGAEDEETRVAVAARVADQLAPRLAGGDHVETVITGAFRDPAAAANVLDRARAIQQQLYPDFDPFEGEGIGRLAKRRGQQFARGATEVVASIPEARAIAEAGSEKNLADTASRWVKDAQDMIAEIDRRLADRPDMPEEQRQRLAEQRRLAEATVQSYTPISADSEAAANIVPAQDRDLYAKGDELRAASENVFGTPDPRDTSFWAAVAEGGGNMTVLAAATILTGPGGVATGATLASAMNKSQLYKEAIDAGANEEVAQRASKWGSAIGATEIIPIGRALKLLPPRLRAKVGNGVLKRFADIAQGAGEEAAQEYLATVANNIVALNLYDPDRGWTEGATEAALVGAVLGGTLGGIGSALNREDQVRAPAAAPPPTPPQGEPPEEAPKIPGDERKPVPTRSEDGIGGENVRPSTGPLGRAADAAPTPIADGLEPGAPVDVSAGPTTVKGTFLRETPGAVVVKDEEGNELEIPRDEFEKGEVSISARTAPGPETPKENPDNFVMVYDDPADVPELDEISGMAEREGERPGRLVPMAEKDMPPRSPASLREEYEGLDPEEAARRASVIQDVAKTTGWDRRLKERYDILMELAQAAEPETAATPETPDVEPAVEEDLDPPEDMEPAPLPVRKRDGSPFANEKTARQAVKNRRLDPEDYDYQEFDGGIIAVPKTDIMARRDDDAYDTPEELKSEPGIEEAVASGNEDATASIGSITPGDGPVTPDADVAENSPPVEQEKAEPEGPASVSEAGSTTEPKPESSVERLANKDSEVEPRQPRQPTRPMRDADDRIQPDMLGGPSKTETQMAAEERTAREWGQFLGIASRGTPEWDGEIEGRPVAVRDAMVRITDPETGATIAERNVDGLSREDIARWARQAIPRDVVENETTVPGEQKPLSRAERPTGPFKLADRLTPASRKALAEAQSVKSTTPEIGELVGDLDSAARRAEAQRRSEIAKGNDGKQPESLVEQAAAIAERVLSAKAKMVFPDRDEATGEWNYETGSPEVAEALEFLDTFEAMGTWIDTVDPEAGTGYGSTTPPPAMPKDQVFPEVKRTVNLDRAAKATGEMDLEEAKARIEEWKQHARDIGKTGANKSKLIISLFDYTGAWSQPFEDAGYQVIRHDIKTGSDLLRDAWIQEVIDDHMSSGLEVAGVLSACPCTTFAGSGARWWKERHDVETQEALATVFGEQALSSGAKSPLEYNLMLLDATRSVIERTAPSEFHVLENPVGRIQTAGNLPNPAARFHPYNFGDPYTKYTQLFGKMNTDLPFANVDPIEGSKIQAKLRGDDAQGKEARSTTPEGFAYAFFMANDPTARKLKDNQADAAPADLVRNRPVHVVKKGDTVETTRAPGSPAPKKEIEAAAAETDTSPTEAQKEAENYKTGKVQWNGLTLSIENPKGSERSKKTPDGKTEWSVTMPAHYGRILLTKGADGDHVDFYMGDNPDSKKVWVVDQLDLETKAFDEHKVMLGFATRDAAVEAYWAGFSDGKGPQRMIAATEFEVIDLIEWLKGNDMKPVSIKAGGNQGRPTPKKTSKSGATSKQTPDSVKSDPEKLEEASDSPDRTYGSQNKLVSADRAAKLRERLKAKLDGSQLNSGFDPEILAIGAELAAFHIEAGSRRFIDLARAIAADLGTTPKALKPYLRGWYNGARDMMEDSGLDIEGMDAADRVSTIVSSGAIDVLAAADPSMFTKGSQPDIIEKSPQEAESDDNRRDASDDRPSAEESAPDTETGPESPGELRAKGGGESRSRDRDAERPAGRSEPRADGARDRAGERDQRSDNRPRPRNHVIETGGLDLARGEKTRARESIEAIRTLRTLQEESRPATEAEREKLAKYGGAGTLASALPRSDGSIKHEDLAADLKELLTDEEMATLSRTSQYAFYTAEPVVRSMWGLASRLGADQVNSRIFEPGMGVGNFPGTMPKDFRSSSYRGIELDHVTAQIAKALYPNHQIEHGDFIETKLPQGFYDLAIGNPPFAGTKIQADRDYPQRFMIHDYFFAKSLDAVRPGGLLMFVTSAGTMNKQDSAARDYLADRADLVGAIRLPNTAFKENGTDVTTDIVVLRKRLEGEAEANPAWRKAVKTSLVDADGTTGEAFVNQYFLDNPEMILGEQGLFDTLTASARVGVRPRPDSDLRMDLFKALEAFPRNVVSPREADVTLEALDTDHAEQKAGSYYLQSGDLHQFDGTIGRRIEKRSRENTKGMPKAAMETVTALIPIRDALRDVYAADVSGKDATEARSRLNKAYDAFVKKRGPIGLQQRSLRRPSIVEQETARQRAFEDARNAGRTFDQGSFDPSRLFEDGATMAQIARARSEARERGGYREGDFNPDDMPSKVVVKRPNIDPFMDDPESFRLLAIEKYDEKTDTAQKSRVFTENAVKISVEPKIQSPEDALLHLLAETGEIDLDRIAELSGSDRTTVRQELGDKVFLNPETRAFETKAKYLSGNVRTKLRVAQDAALKDPALSINVSSLEEIQPDVIPSSDIRVPIGAHWFEAAIYSEFAQSLGLNLRAQFKPSLGIWSVDGTDAGGAATNEFGTPDYPFATLMRTMMNNKKIEVRRKPKDKPSYVDEEATQAATDKAVELQEKWGEWLWSDDVRRGDLEELYNEKFNAEVAPSYDGSYLTTPGIHSDWRWRPHQTSVIARILQSGSTYMAHTVGAGKTSAMIGAGMEARRLGIAKKPMYVVPNHMLVQFTTEFYQQYPLAKILVADDKRFHTSRRKQFIADAALGDWDAIIITHSGFEKIPASEASRMAAVEAMISDMRDVIDSTDGGDDMSVDRSILGALGSVASIAGLDVKNITDGEKKTRKKIEALMEAAEQRVKRQASTDKKDQVFDFDELGVDMLFVDEAHLFRKLSFATTNGSIKGIDPAGSQKSMDLYVKAQALEKQNPGRSLVFASGTPITNTMAELYSLSRYLQPLALDERGIGAFDAWAATFGTTSSDLEQTPDGGYKQVARFAKFVNTPELSLMVRQVMDVVSSSDLDQYVTRPKIKGGQRQLIVVPASKEVKDYQSFLGQRMKAIENRKGPVSKGDDILLSVINDGRLAAIDMRLVAGEEKTSASPNTTGEDSKLERMIDEIYARWKSGAKARLHGVKPEGGYTDKPIETGPSTQIVFSTLGISGTKHNPAFGVHRFVKAQLMERGVPATDIILAEDLKTDALKQRAFNDMNEGKKRILVGSKNLFTGVNAQRRIIAIHNLDPLWFPADDEQRNGRGLRQGNMNPEIEILDYTTKGTYDATMWQMMARKAAFIEAFYRGDPTVREIEDLGEASAYDQAKAMSTADPRVLRLTEMKAEADVLDRRRRAAETQKRRLETTIDVKTRNLQSERKRLSPWEEASNRVENLKGDAFKAKVGSVEYDSRKDFGAALIDAAEDILARDGSAGDNVKVGSISGFDIVGWGSKAAQEVYFDVVAFGRENFDVGFSDDPVGMARKIETALSRIADMPARITERLQATERQIGDAKDQLGKLTGFKQMDELVALEDKIADLEAELLADAKTDDKEMRAPEGWGEAETAPETQPELTDDQVGQIAQAVQAEMKQSGLSGRVPAKVVRSMAEFGKPDSVRGVYRAGGEIGVKADENTMGTLHHEIVHALRDKSLWGRAYGLFTEAEWKGLVRAARADKALMADIEARYPNLLSSGKLEEAVAEQYRVWRAGSDVPRGTSVYQKMQAFLEALTNAFRGQGFQSQARTFEAMASGTVGRRSSSVSQVSYTDGAGAEKELRVSNAAAVTDVGQTKESERKRIGQMLTNAMQGDVSLLALVPGRALFAELGAKIPAAKTYLNMKEAMDALRQDWHAKTDEVAQAWRKLIRKDGDANKALMDLMHETTRNGIDPSEPFRPKSGPEDRSILRDADLDSYAYQKAQERIDADKRRRAQYEDMRAKFQALPSDYQAMYARVRDQYAEMADEFEQTVVENAQKSMTVGLERAKRRHKEEMDRIRDEGLEGEEKAAAIEAADTRLADAKKRNGWNKNARLSALRARFESNRIDGPYFPLARFGRFFMTARDKAGKVVSFSRFETENAQQAEAKRLRKNPELKVEVGVIDEKMNWKDQVDPNFVADIEDMIGGELGNAGSEVMDLIWQRWLETLPDFSIRKSRIHRKGTEGYDGDAFRAFGRQMFHGSHQLARLKYGLEMQNALEDARIQAQRTDDPNRAGLIVTEMEKRHEFTMNPTGSKFAQTATSAAFVYYLSVTPSAALVNISQTTVVGIPVIRAGLPKTSIGQVSRALMKALRDFTAGRGEAARSKNLTDDERAAMREAYRRGTIEKTQSHDLVGVGETGAEYSDTRVRWMARISYLFHHAERLNREVTFLASYRLARSSGIQHEAAIDKAADLTWKAHFDYQNTSRPRLMQSDTAKVLLVFRNFNINMLWRLFRDAHQMMRGATPEARKEARTQLLGISMMMAFHAGVTGVWGYSLISLIAGLVFGMGQDEVEEEIKRSVVETLGPEVGGMVLKGVPGHLGGLDLTQRIGMPDLWFRSSDRLLEGQDGYNYMLSEIAGASVGIIENLYVGAGRVREGLTKEGISTFEPGGTGYRGIETIVPKFVRDLMQAVRFGYDGVNTYNGDPILEEVTSREVLIEALGFTPAKLAERYEMNTRMKNREKRIMKARKDLHRRATDALRDRKPIPESVKDAINEFNAENPTYPITPDSIKRSLSSRMRASARNEFGVQLNTKLNQSIREEAAPGIYN